MPQTRYTAKTIVALVAFTLLSALAFSFQPVVSELHGMGLVLNSTSALSYFALAASIFLFVRLLRNGPFKVHICICCIAVLFGLFTVAGLLLNTSGTLRVHYVAIALGNTVVQNRIAVGCVLLVMLIGYCAFYYACIQWLFLAFSTLQKRLAKGAVCALTLFGHTLSVPICMGVLCVAWLPYVVAFFPGTFMSDTSAHLAQILGTQPLTTHFPFLPGILEAWLFQAGSVVDPSGLLGLFLMIVPQIALGLFVCATIVVWIQRLRMPAGLVYGALAFFALFPLIPAYLVQAGKDTLHALLAALFVLQLVLLWAKGQSGADSAPKLQRTVLCNPAVVALVGVLVAVTRNNGILLVVVALVVFVALTRRYWVLCSAMAACAVFAVWQFLLLPAWGVHSAGLTEACSLPSQVVAACVQKDAALSDDEQTKFSQFYDADAEEIASLYRPTFADPVKAHLTITNAREAGAFAQFAATLAAREPLTATSAALATTYGAWYPFCKGSFHSEDAPYVIATQGGWERVEEWFPSLETLETLKGRTGLATQVVTIFHYLPGLVALYTPGAYLWFMVLLAGYAIWSKRNRKITAIVLSVFLALWAVMLFGPCASLRYCLPAIFSLPVLASLPFLRD